MNETSHTEWIEQFLLGELVGEGLHAFETKMQQDDFRKEVELQQTITQQITYVGEEDFRKKLDSIHASLPANPAVPVASMRSLWTYLSITASVVVLLGIAFWLFQARQTDTVAVPPPKLTFVPLHTQAQPFGVTDVADSIQQMAVLLYSDTLSHYLFNDTLRLYGHWDTTRMQLWYDTLHKHYVLQLDTLRYELQRYVDTRLKP